VIGGCYVDSFRLRKAPHPGQSSDLRVQRSGRGRLTRSDLLIATATAREGTAGGPLTQATELFDPGRHEPNPHSRPQRRPRLPGTHHRPTPHHPGRRLPRRLSGAGQPVPSSPGHRRTHRRHAPTSAPPIAVSIKPAPPSPCAPTLHPARPDAARHAHQPQRRAGGTPSGPAPRGVADQLDEQRAMRDQELFGPRSGWMGLAVRRNPVG
jgi:hypothetical protein